MLERLRQKNLHTWLPGYVASRIGRRAKRVRGPRHLIFAFCDHYEPLWGGADRERGERRVRAWLERYPQMVAGFRDADGLGPRHSFFFPGEQYQPEYLAMLADLARQGHGEVEVHLHHDNDTAASLRADLLRYLELFARHGHLSRDESGRLRYAFIHGNWCLANARRDGKHCGVDNEIPLLFETGCYADYTFPSAPDECQPNVVNRLYWPVGDTSRRRAYERGEPARTGARYRDRILLVEGPLSIARRRSSLVPRIESAAVTANDPATPSRVATWARQGVHVEGRPEWVFVKVHTHGAPEAQAASLLGEAGRAMHAELTTRYNDGARWVLHYVTAREMFNIAVAAMAGRDGDPALFRDFELAPPPVARRESLRASLRAGAVPPVGRGGAWSANGTALAPPRGHAVGVGRRARGDAGRRATPAPTACLRQRALLPAPLRSGRPGARAGSLARRFAPAAALDARAGAGGG